MSKDVGMRLAVEAERLGLNDTEAARAAKVSRRTWLYAKSGTTSIKSDTLQALDSSGFDILYIVTGRHQWPRKSR